MISAIKDGPTRDFLTTEGLPSEHLLFAANESDAVHLSSAANGNAVLQVGVVGDCEDLCIDIETGHVVAIHGADGSVWHVNANVIKFADSLKSFASSFPFYRSGSDPTEWESAAQRFHETLENLDETAFAEDPGYWHTILHDIAIGDYSDE